MLPNVHLFGHLSRSHFASSVYSSFCSVCFHCNHHRAPHYTVLLNGSLNHKKAKATVVSLLLQCVSCPCMSQQQ